jgi:hypothetical protein
LKGKIEIWWSQSTPQDKAYITKKFGPFALESEDPEKWWSFWKKLVNHDGADQHPGAYVWDSFVFMLRIGVRLYYTIQTENQIVASPSHEAISMHAVFYYAASNDQPAYQFAINDCMNLKALRSQIEFYGMDYIASGTSNSGFTTGKQLPILRLHYILKHCGNRYTDCLLGEKLDNQLTEMLKVLKEWKKQGTDREYRLILDEHNQNRWSCLECGELIDLFLVDNGYCYGCFVAEYEKGQAKSTSSHVDQQLKKDAAHALKYCAPIVDRYWAAVESKKQATAADAAHDLVNTIALAPTSSIQESVAEPSVQSEDENENQPAQLLMEITSTSNTASSHAHKRKRRGGK